MAATDADAELSATQSAILAAYAELIEEVGTKLRSMMSWLGQDS